ncbi:hypothetical protein [Bifidobacterium sp. ESL0745]|uniref:hypothetical protein n=1 Tax=Bifidobacterium sp. ESL0745 TaxID=2983226 RepID=UPI0023F6E4F9|nr:hypothetical protein [Bifidobacterium sp. ESL0745]MDF7666034.1 hypothetical protein [Bifidobacterium sp. ESL0745]
MKKSRKIAVASFAAVCTLFAGIGFANAAEPPAGPAPVVSAQANYDRSELQTQYNNLITLRDSNAGKLGQYSQYSWLSLLNDINKAQPKLDPSKDGQLNIGGAKDQKDITDTANSIKTDLELGLLQSPKANELKADAPMQNAANLQAFYNKVKDVAQASYPSATQDQWDRFDGSRTHASWTLGEGGDDIDMTRAFDDLYADTYNLDQNLLPTISAPAAPAPAPVDKKAALRTAYDKVKDYNQADFASVAWPAFDAERTAAKTLLDKADATQAELDAEVNTLNAKVGALVNIAKLKADVAKASGLKASDYGEFSWYLMSSFSLPYAKSVLGNNAAAQSEVDNADIYLSADIADLKTPVAGQKTGADVPATVKTKADLTALVAQADKLQQGDYTADSWKVFAGALKYAKDALNPQQSDLLRDNDVDDYTYEYVQLEDAQSALVRNASAAQNNQAQPTAAQPQANGAAAGSNSGLATTGAAVSVVAVVMALFAGLAVAIKLVERKRA